MAADTPLVSANDFSDEEWSKLEKLAGEDGPYKFAREVVRATFEELLAKADPDPYADDEPEDDMPPEGSTESAEDDEETLAPALAFGDVAVLLERLDRLERGMQEMIIWARTVLSELYAHTGFTSADQERKARAKALEKLALIEKSVAAELGRNSGNGTLN